MCAAFHLGTGDSEEIQRIADEITKKYGPDTAGRYLDKDYFPKEEVPVIGAGNQVSLLRWGFPMKGTKRVVFNARAESLAEKSLFRVSLGNRCLVPVSSFYEWDSEKRKYSVAVEGAKLFYLAAIWKKYMNETGDKLFCFTIVTTSPNKQMQPIHNRMPAIIPPDLTQAWLNPGTEPLSLFRPFESSILISEVKR